MVSAVNSVNPAVFVLTSSQLLLKLRLYLYKKNKCMFKMQFEVSSFVNATGNCCIWLDPVHRLSKKIKKCLQKCVRVHGSFIV